MISPSLALSANEFLDEFVHAVLEDIVHVAVLQAIADAAGMALRGALAAIGDADLAEIAHQVAVTNWPANAAAYR